MAEEEFKEELVTSSVVSTKSDVPHSHEAPA